MIDPNSAASPELQFFLHSLAVVDGNGNLVTENGAPIGSINPASYSQGGVYRSPSPLPNGKFLVSFSSATDPTNFDARRTSSTSWIRARRRRRSSSRPAASSTPSPCTASTTTARSAPPSTSRTETRRVDGTQTDAQIFVLDMSVLGSLLFQNTPTGRAIEGVDQGGNDVGLDSFDVYEELPPRLERDRLRVGRRERREGQVRAGVRAARRKLGTVDLEDDKSTYFSIPGGVPIVLHLPDTSVSQAAGYPRWQHEEMTFYPGERSHQSFQATFFNGLCGLCHGAVSGAPSTPRSTRTC